MCSENNVRILIVQKTFDNLTLDSSITTLIQQGQNNMTAKTFRVNGLLAIFSHINKHC